MKSRVAEWAASAAGGLAVLGLLRALAPWLGFSLQINGAALTVAGVLGLPGVIGLLALHALLFLV